MPYATILSSGLAYKLDRLELCAIQGGVSKEANRAFASTSRTHYSDEIKKCHQSNQLKTGVVLTQL